MIIRRTFARTALKLARWKTVGSAPRAGIFVGAPHTSNWDWVATISLLWSQGVAPRVLVKRELFKGPVGLALRATGGIPIDRDNADEVVRELAEHAARDDSFVIVLAAEGTRTKGEHWKSGFYRLSRQTGIPVTFGSIDGPTRTMRLGLTMAMTGDAAADMDKIRAYYADAQGLRPERRTEPRLRDETAGS
ncbi:MAG: 1-acyl-sn-glycerol-3-phosphate acyltransferase [Nocardioides sp.]|nr:1-acyl-sn-glycerol-3-phosphate acyltransferase [Nocardioides sp.]